MLSTEQLVVTNVVAPHRSEVYKYITAGDTCTITITGEPFKIKPSF